MTRNTKILLGVGVAGVLALVIYKLTKKSKDTTTGELPAPKKNTTTEPEKKVFDPNTDYQQDYIPDWNKNVYKIYEVKTQGGNLNVREKPFLSSKIRTTISNGQKLRATTTTENGWLLAFLYTPKSTSKTPYAEQLGFVSTKYLKYLGE